MKSIIYLTSISIFLLLSCREANEEKGIAAEINTEEEPHALQLFYDHAWEMKFLYVYKIKLKDNDDAKYYVAFDPPIGPSLALAAAGKEYDSLAALLSDYKKRDKTYGDVWFLVGKDNGEKFYPPDYLNVNIDFATLLPINIEELENLMGEKGAKVGPGDAYISFGNK